MRFVSINHDTLDVLFLGFKLLFMNADTLDLLKRVQLHQYSFTLIFDSMFLYKNHERILARNASQHPFTY